MTITRIDAPADSLLGWTLDRVAASSENLKPGDLVVIVRTHGGFWSYRACRVEAVNLGGRRRVVVEQFGSFYLNGKNCFEPKGQTRMVPLDHHMSPYLKEAGDEAHINGRYPQFPKDTP